MARRRRGPHRLILRLSQPRDVVVVDERDVTAPVDDRHRLHAVTPVDEGWCTEHGARPGLGNRLALARDEPGDDAEVVDVVGRAGAEASGARVSGKRGQAGDRCNARAVEGRPNCNEVPPDQVRLDGVEFEVE